MTNNADGPLSPDPPTNRADGLQSSDRPTDIERRQEILDRREENLNKWWEIDWMLRKIEQRVSWLETWSREQSSKQMAHHEQLANLHLLLDEARRDLKETLTSLNQQAIDNYRQWQKVLWFVIATVIGGAGFLIAQLIHSLDK